MYRHFYSLICVLLLAPIGITDIAVAKAAQTSTLQLPSHKCQTKTPKRPCRGCANDRDRSVRLHGVVTR
jgi:hypothetical protein